MIKNIIFDLGNVIINYNQDKIISEFTKKEEEIAFIKEKIFNSPEWKMMDLGELTNDEAIKNIQKRNDTKYSKLTEKFLHQWYKKQSINEDIVNIAMDLQQLNYNIYVLSNMANATFEYFKNIDFFKICKGVIISAHEHRKKPDEKIFKLFLERYQLNANECLFIDDDDTDKSYKIANEIGILGRRVKPNDREDIIKLLNEFGVKLDGSNY